MSIKAIAAMTSIWQLTRKFLSSDNSAVDPPDPMPNSEVKCSSADGSVGVPM